MRIRKGLASMIAMAAAVATVGVPSAFAETRTAPETKARAATSSIVVRAGADDAHDRGDSESRSARAERREDRRHDRREDRRDRIEERRDDRRDRMEERRDHRRDRMEHRRDHRRDRRAERRDHRRDGHRQAYYHHGRVSHYQRHGNGYRVWLSGARFPFFVPLHHWHRDRFRVGLSVRLGGYYNPGGYYEYYDSAYSRGALRGVVESVDYRRDTFVIRNEATGSFVTCSAAGAVVMCARATTSKWPATGRPPASSARTTSTSSTATTGVTDPKV